MTITLNTEITDYGQKLTTIDGDPVAIIKAVFGAEDGHKWEVYMASYAHEFLPFRSLEAAQYRVLAEHIEAKEAASWKRTAERFATT